MNQIKKKRPPIQKNNSENSVHSVKKTRCLVPLLLDWFATNARDLPWRRTRDPYAIWVSEIMLQQTQVKTVMPYWARWMRELPTIESAAAASPDKIHKLWEGLGYYTRARNLQKAAQEIVKGGKRKVESGNAEFPHTFKEVLALPGIGRYTAGAICSIAFNQPTPILDGNVIRVLTRVFGIAENPKENKTNRLLWKLAEKLVGRALRCPPYQNRCSRLNQSLMELGALVCTPRNPQCLICPIKKECVAFRKNRIDELPNLGKREKATARRFIAFVVERDGKFLVRQRPAGIVNAHFWEFPNVEMVNGNSNPKLAAKTIFGIEPAKLEHFHTLKHSITRYRITLDAFQVQLKNHGNISDGIWRTHSQLQRLAFSSAHKKILTKLGGAQK